MSAPPDASPPTMETRAPFPSNPDDFGTDERISYSKIAQTYLLEDETGQEWEWLPGPARWSQTLDEQLMKQQAEIYKVPGVDEDAPALNPGQKRKEAQLEHLDSNPKSSKAQATSNATAAAAKPNTAVFVTGLPLDADFEEIRDYFKRFGVIMESMESDRERIKMYTDKDGNFNGEALIVFLKRESLNQAIPIGTGDFLPRHDYNAPVGGKMLVVEANTNYKSQKNDNEGVAPAQETVPNGQKGRGKVSKAMVKKKMEKLHSRLGDWSDDEPSTIKQTSSRWDKLVVLKNVFDAKELADDYAEDGEEVFDDIKEAMQEKAEKFGVVKNVTVFDLEEDGVVTIRFSNAVAADACARGLNGLGFDGRKVATSIATGEEMFKKTRVVRNREEEEAKRLENYSNFIEGKAGSDQS